MRLPNADRAVIDVAKLRDYCLNPNHPRGKHKARVFASVLGVHNSDAELMRLALLRAVAETESAVRILSDRYGERYNVDIQYTHGKRTALIRTTWLVRSGEDFPRMITCYVL